MPSKRSAAIVLSILAVLAHGLRLDHDSLAPWDEAIYADAARNVLDGHVFVMELSGKGHELGTGIFLEKPPFVPWLQALSIAIFGDSPVAVRLPSFLAFVACVALVVYIASELMNTRAGIIAGLFLALSPWATAGHGPLYGSTDVVLILFGSLAVWLWFQYQHGKEHQSWRIYGAAGSLAVAVMTKGVAAGPFALVALPALYWRPKTLRTRPFWRATGLFLLLASPWYLYVYLAAGDVFIQQFFVQQVVRRATGELFVEPGGIFPWMRAPYFIESPQRLGLGMSLVVVVGVSVAILKSLWEKTLHISGSILYVSFWTLTFPILYAVMGGNHLWYVYPSVVPLTVLAAWSIENLTEWVDEII